MNIDVNLVIGEYEKVISDLQRKVILLKVENDQLKKLLEDKDRKESKDAKSNT